MMTKAIRILATCLLGIMLFSMPAYAEAAQAPEAPMRKTIEESPDTEARTQIWDEMIEANGEDVTWPLETWAEYSRRLEENGLIHSDDFVYGLPADDEVQLEEALGIAGGHLLAEMGFKDGMLDRFSTYTRYIVNDEDKPYYHIAFNPKNASEYEEIGAYLCIIDGKSGEVLEFHTPADAVG